MVKNLPCNAGDVGSTLSQGTKISHAMEQLRGGPECPTTEPAHSSYWSLCALKPTLQSPCSALQRSHMMQHRFHLLQLKPDTAKQIRKKKREAVSGRNPEKHQQSWIKAEKRSKVNEKEGQEVESRPGKVWWNKWVHFFPLLLFPTSSYYSPLLLGPLLQPPNNSPCSVCHFPLILHLAATVVF